MMLEKTPPTLKINPKTRSNNPVTARQMIKAVLEQQEQQVPFDVFFDGIVDETKSLNCRKLRRKFELELRKCCS